MTILEAAKSVLLGKGALTTKEIYQEITQRQ